MLAAFPVMAIITSDLSNRTRREALNARRSERELREVIEAIPAMAFTALPDGTNAFANRRWQEYTGLPAEETISGPGWQSTVHADDFERHIHKWRASLASGEPFENEVRHRSANGEYRWFLIRAVPLRDERGNILNWYGVLTDIEDRKRAEDASRERESRIRRLVDANIIGIFLWEIEGRILEANDAFLCMLGYDRDDLVSGRLRWTELTPSEYVRDLQEAVSELKKTGHLQPYEREYFRKDGSRVPVLIGEASFDDTASQGVAFVLDLTERKRAEQALRRSEAYLAEAQRLSKTGSWPAGFWALGPALAETLFDAGRRRATSKSARANYDASVATYRQTSLTAFPEVEDNLAALRILENEAQQQDQAVASSTDSLHLFTNRYKGGVDTYLQVITAQTIELANERNAIDILRRRMDASVLLVKALGGGWNASNLPTFGASSVRDY